MIDNAWYNRTGDLGPVSRDWGLLEVVPDDIWRMPPDKPSGEGPDMNFQWSRIYAFSDVQAPFTAKQLDRAANNLLWGSIGLIATLTLAKALRYFHHPAAMVGKVSLLAGFAAFNVFPGAHVLFLHWKGRPVHSHSD